MKVQKSFIKTMIIILTNRRDNMADRIIYKCLRQDENGNEIISYAPTEDYYQLDTIGISEIEFDANNIESLCNALNNSDQNYKEIKIG